MNIALWIVASVLAAAFLMAGLMKATQPKAKLAPNMPWVESYSAGTVKFIGVMEVLGAIGLILPGVLSIAPVLVPLAATGLAVTMLLAIVMVHAPRKEWANVAVNLILLVLAAFVAILRFGPYPL